MLQEKSLNGVKIYSIDKEKLEKKLEEISKKIKKEKLEVEKIIVFGSFAKGNYTPFSDVDIAIIVRKSNKKFLERQDEFIEYFDDVEIDVNLIIYTKEEFEKLIKERNSFVKEILKGKEV